MAEEYVNESHVCLQGVFKNHTCIALTIYNEPEPLRMQDKPWWLWYPESEMQTLQFGNVGSNTFFKKTLFRLN